VIWLFSFILAAMLRTLKSRGAFFRNALLLPYLMPSSALLLIWLLMFDYGGVVNRILAGLGLNRVLWLEGGALRVPVVLLYIWKNLGFSVVIFAAALQTVPEAYYEYASMLKDYPDTRAYLKKYPNLILTRTFSKIYGLAGLRIGYAFSSPEIVDYLDRIRPPFNINLAAQAAAVASLDDPDQVKKGVRLNAEQKKVLYTAFDAMGLQCLPSAGNFVLVNVSPMKGNDVFKQMLRKGVIVRAMDEYNLHDFVRITIGTPAENKMMLAALKAVLSGK
jgi:hypothetical protein